MSTDHVAERLLTLVEITESEPEYNKKSNAVYIRMLVNETRE